MPKLNPYDRTHLSHLTSYERKILQLYNEAVRKVALAASSIQGFNSENIFSFNNYPILRAQVNKLLSGLNQNVQAAIVNGIEAEWTLANNKNSELARQVFGDNIGKLSQAQYRRYFSNNDTALQAFLSRKEGGLDLSQRVWKYTGAFKSELEMGLDLGIRNGLSAAEMTKDLRDYLQHPDKLFRRVRDEHGNLHLSKAAADFHPGQGVYRSSYMNARRLAATETNIAYHTADYERWQQMDFVVGIEIVLSNNHNCKGVPEGTYFDICDELAGQYPKDFKFTGWHPHCRCHAITILKTWEEQMADSRRLMNGEEIDGQSVNRVEDVPDKFKEWVEDNKERIERSQSMPYFLRENQGYLDSIRTAPTYGMQQLTIPQIQSEVTAQRTTEDIFRTGARWSAPRAELHDRIVAEYTTGATHKGDVVYMLGGAPANGKSTLVDSGLLPHPKGALVIDADKIKAMLPEYRSMTASGVKALVKAAANFVHEESSHVGKLIQQKVFREGITPVIDGVNDGSYDKVFKKVQGIKAATAGKRIRADYVTLDTDLSVKLANARAQKTGRVVPLDFIINNNREISKLIPQLIENPVFDELYLWDTNTVGKPVLILKMIDGKLTIKDAKLYERFLAKAR